MLQTIPKAPLAAAAFALAASCLICAQSLYAQETPAQTAPAQDPKSPADVITESAPATLPPEDSVMSLQCAVPAHEIATPAPLPATIAKLQAGKKLRILAIGAAAVQQFDRKTSRISESSQFANLLGKVLKDTKIEMINRGVSG